MQVTTSGDYIKILGGTAPYSCKVYQDNRLYRSITVSQANKWYKFNDGCSDCEVDYYEECTDKNGQRWTHSYTVHSSTQS